MSTADLSALAARVLLAAFFLSFLFGALARRTHFCTMGAISDAVNMGDTTRLRQWGMAAGIAMLGFWALALGGLVDPSKTLYSGNRWLWLSGLVGGGLFGFGMVLASGCGSKNLIRLGGGSLKALVVFLVLGVSAFATLKGVTAVVRVATVERAAIEFSGPATLASGLSAATGWPPAAAGMALALVLGGGLVAWALASRDFRTRDNLLAGLGVGLLITAMWWVSGHLGHVAEHPETLEEVFIATNSGRAEAMSFVSPVAYTLDWLLFFSDKSKVLTLGIVSVLGVIAGSAVVAVAGGSFRWEGFAGTEDLANHLAGGVLMGVGGVTAFGCTVGQGLSGIATLSLTSATAVLGIAAGAVAAFRYQLWRMERNEPRPQALA